MEIVHESKFRLLEIWVSGRWSNVSLPSWRVSIYSYPRQLYGGGGDYQMLYSQRTSYVDSHLTLENEEFPCKI